MKPALRFPRLTACAVALSLGMPSHSAWSQAAIKFVVPFGPGGGLDILARLLAEEIGRQHGASIMIENRAGAGTIVATEAVAEATPDGNTLLFVPNPFVINSHLRKLPYDPLKSFEPICHLVSSPNLLVVNATSPYRFLADLVGAARIKPGALTLASVGPGSASQIAFEKLKQTAQIEMTFVPYQATPAAINALLGDHVSAVFAGYADVFEQVNANKLRALAVASPARIPPRPDLPTVAEQGYKDYEVELWYGVVAPAMTPKETVSRLADWFTAALQAPGTKAKLLAQALYPLGVCGAEFSAFLRRQYDDYGRVIREANIKVD